MSVLLTGLMVWLLNRAMDLAKLYGHADIEACLEMSIADIKHWIAEDEKELCQ